MADVIAGQGREDTMSASDRQKLDLDYPCLWIYKIIGPNQDELQNAVHNILQKRQYRITLSRISPTARYISMNVELTVENDADRVAVYEALKTHRAVTMVL